MRESPDFRALDKSISPSIICALNFEILRRMRKSITTFGLRKTKKTHNVPTKRPTYHVGKKSKKRRTKPPKDEKIKIFKTFFEGTSIKSESSFLTISST